MQVVRSLIREVFPVCAGMSPSASADAFAPVGFPRMRGDEPSFGLPLLSLVRFSPYARG